MTHFIFPVPSAKQDFQHLKCLLEKRNPFVYMRFSDGETEIIRNNHLEINEDKLIFQGNTLSHNYPLFDRKTFNPLANQEFRADLMASAVANGQNYFKGVPASHNSAELDRNLMIRLNGGLSPSLTFSDLFLNGNFRPYRKTIVPLFDLFEHVAVIGNYRMRPNLYRRKWSLIEIPDDFFMTYHDVKKSVLRKIQQLPKNSLVLSSASSLSNVIGHFVFANRSDVTFVDIGTTLHDLMNMETGIRRYHIELEPWTIFNFMRKLRYKFANEYRLRW